MIKSDHWIAEHCLDVERPIIEPFNVELVRWVPHGILKRKIISRGLTSYGYDIQLDPTSLKVFSPIQHGLVDPKDFNDQSLVEAPLHSSDSGAQWWLLPAHTYALGVSVEYFRMPRNVTALCYGKSTYARCGIICNCTPLEAGWEGNLVLELSNSCSVPVRIYANEGIAQIVFFEADEDPMVSYADRSGKYQGQTGVTTAKL